MCWRGSWPRRYVWVTVKRCVHVWALITSQTSDLFLSQGRWEKRNCYGVPDSGFLNTSNVTECWLDTFKPQLVLILTILYKLTILLEGGWTSVCVVTGYIKAPFMTGTLLYFNVFNINHQLLAFMPPGHSHSVAYTHQVHIFQWLSFENGLGGNIKMSAVGRFLKQHVELTLAQYLSHLSFEKAKLTATG